MNAHRNEKPFGYYRPDRSTSILRALTKLGISRGAVKKWIARQWKKKGYSIVDTSVRGINYRLDLRDNTTDMKILTGSKFYDGEEIRHLAKSIGNSDDATFVDIGANTGYYSLNLARLGYSKVIAIEPNPPTIARLKCNIKANEMGKNITVIPVCIGDGKDVQFFCSGDLGTASVFAMHSCASEPITVHTKPLMDIICEHGVKRIEGLKIDIEGFEDRCLFPFYKSSSKKLWPRIVVIEDSHKSLWEKDIIEEMQRIGYTAICKTRGNQIFKLAI